MRTLFFATALLCAPGLARADPPARQAYPTALDHGTVVGTVPMGLDTNGFAVPQGSSTCVYACGGGSGGGGPVTNAGTFAVQNTAATPPGTNTIGGVTIAPSSASANGITSVVSGSAASNLVLKASAGNLYSVYALSTVAGYLMVFNATSAPGNGATTAGVASGNMVECAALNANQPTSITFIGGPPEVYSVGIVAVVSSNAAGCSTLTASATAFIHGSVQ